MLKRELIFVGVAAVVIAGYLFAGLKLAPEIPPKPETADNGPMTVDEFIARQDTIRKQEAKRNHAIEEHNQFLETWRQWGAGIGIVLIILYTLWRPPWYVRATREAPPKPPGSSKEPKPGKSSKSRAFNGRVSRRALLMMSATLFLLIAAAVLLAWGLSR